MSVDIIYLMSVHYLRLVHPLSSLFNDDIEYNSNSVIYLLCDLCYVTCCDISKALFEIHFLII